MIETKHVGGRVVETKEAERNGVPVGIIEGYTATWDIDRGSSWQSPDRFVKGAFSKSIERHKAAGNRQIRLTWQHRELMGGIPIDTVKEDDIGLFGAAEVNLETVEGKAAYSLAKQGVLVDFSIGFEVMPNSDSMEDGVRVITESEYWHSALVDEPMNPAAQVTAVKAHNIEDVKNMTRREIEAALIEAGFSRDAAKFLAAGRGGPDAQEELTALAEEIRGFTEAIR